MTTPKMLTHVPARSSTPATRRAAPPRPALRRPATRPCSSGSPRPRPTSRSRRERAGRGEHGGLGLFVIEEGRVARPTRAPRRLELGPGEVVGELALLTDGGPPHGPRPGRDAGPLPRDLARTTSAELLDTEPRLALSLLETWRRLAARRRPRLDGGTSATLPSAGCRIAPERARRREGRHPLSEASLTASSRRGQLRSPRSPGAARASPESGAGVGVALLRTPTPAASTQAAIRGGGSPMRTGRMGVLSPAVENLVAQLTRLPGVGTRTAQRLAFHLLQRPKDEALALAARDRGGEGARALLPRVRQPDRGGGLRDLPDARRDHSHRLRRRAAGRPDLARADARVPRPLPRARRRALAARRRRARAPAHRRAAAPGGAERRRRRSCSRRTRT